MLRPQKCTCNFLETKIFIQEIDYKFFLALAHFITFWGSLTRSKKYFSRGGLIGTHITGPINFLKIEKTK